MPKPIISFLVILISVGAVFFYVIPEYNLVQKTSVNLAEISDIFKDANSIEKLIDDTRKTLEGVPDEDLARFEVFLPETSDTIRFANNLQYIGLKNGFVLENLKVEESTSRVQKSAGSGAVAVAQSAAQSAVQGAATVFTIGRKAELSQEAYERSKFEAEAGAVTVGKKYVTTKASFGLEATLPEFGLLLNDLETSLRIMNVTGLSFSPISETEEMKKAKIVTPPIYKFSVTIEAYSLK